MQNTGRNIARWLALAATALLVACGGGGGGSPPAPTYTIGGTPPAGVSVNGVGPLASGLVLRVNGGDDLAVSGTGTFTFSTPVPSSTSYTVTVAVQPSTQNCAVTGGGTGIVGSSNVTNVAVACTPVPTRTVGGTINGLLGSGLELRLNGTSSFVTTATGTFSFTFTPLEIGDGNPYTVTVAAQPTAPVQVCSVVNGTGTVAVGTPVTDVAVNCALPTPRFAYVANLSNSQIQAFGVMPDGSLTFVASTALGGTATNYAVGVEPSGRFAYVVSNGLNGTVTAASINSSTGALTSIGAIVAGTTPEALGIDPLGRFLYVTNRSGSSVTGFRINATNGRLVSVGAPAPAGTTPVSVAIEPRGRFAYVANAGSGTVSHYSVANDGSLTFVASVNELTQPAPFAVDPLGRFGYTPRVLNDNISAYTIGTTTGTLTAVGVPTPTGTSPSLVVFDPLGRFAFVINSPIRPALGSISRYSIDAATGALTSLGGTTPTGDQAPVAASVDPSGQFLYVLHTGTGGLGGTIRVFSVDSAGAVLPILTSLTVANNASSFAITR